MRTDCQLQRKAVIPESEAPLMTDRGFIKTDDRFRTNIDGLYAIGDDREESFLAHMASAQGIHVINTIKDRCPFRLLHLSDKHLHYSRGRMDRDDGRADKGGGATSIK